MNFLSPGSVLTLSGIFITGAGILSSIPFKNSTLEISARLLPPASVTLMTTFLIATCFPRLMIMVPSGSMTACAAVRANMDTPLMGTSMVCRCPFSSSYSTVTDPARMILAESLGGVRTSAPAVISERFSRSSCSSTGFSSDISPPSAGSRETLPPSPKILSILPSDTRVDAPTSAVISSIR